MELKKLIYTVDADGIAVITMNYMKNLNAIDEQMADELMYVVDAAEKDPNVKVVVLKGTDRAFSAGGDIGYFYNLIQAGGLPRPEYIHNMPYSLKPNIPTVFQFSNIHIKYAKVLSFQLHYHLL